MMETGRKTLCEFFAGIGLVHEGLRRSGWQCVYANDIDEKKARVFREHFHDADHLHVGDIWETDEVVNRIKGTPFMATASFPCTDLSLAGHWRGLNGKESSTYFAFLKVLEKLNNRRPQIVMLENVPSFLTSGGGTDFPTAMSALASLGYWIDAFIVDAKHFVPQSRPRLFVIAVSSQLSSPLIVRSNDRSVGDPWLELITSNTAMRPKSLIKLMQTHALPTGWFTLPLKAPTTAKHSLDEVIDQDDDQDWWDRDRVQLHYERMHDYCRRDIDELLKAKAKLVTTAYRRTRKGVVRTEVRFDGIAGCLRTTKGGSARQIVIVVDDGTLRMRWMSPREYARLQGAGHYRLVGNNEHEQMFGFGDAVCVPVIQWIDDHVLTPLYETGRTLRRRRAAVA